MSTTNPQYSLAVLAFNTTDLSKLYKAALKHKKATGSNTYLIHTTVEEAQFLGLGKWVAVARMTPDLELARQRVERLNAIDQPNNPANQVK